MKVVNDYMSRLISRIGNDLGLVKEGFKSCWVTDFPMFEENSEGGHLQNFLQTLENL